MNWNSDGEPGLFFWCPMPGPTFESSLPAPLPDLTNGLKIPTDTLQKLVESLHKGVEDVIATKWPNHHGERGVTLY